MSILSKEVAKWCQMCPGPIGAETEAEVWSKAQMQFCVDRRWRTAIEPGLFMKLVNNIGYRIDHRDRFESGKKIGYFVLALPAKHRGF